MRRLLDVLYLGAGWLAALFMVGVLVMVLVSIVSRLAGIYVPGTDAYAGYAMAGAGFLALAYTLKQGEHIRVTLIIGRLAGGARRAMELWSLAVGTLLAGLLCVYSWRLVYQSRLFHDISTGTDATPLWIPQLLMGLGCTVLLVALIDETVLEWRGQRQQHAGDTRHE